MKRSLLFFYALTASILFSSCEVIGDIFKAGFWSAILLVGVIVIVLIFVLAKVFKKK